MPLPILRNMMIQSGQKLSIEFFSDEDIEKIFYEISCKMEKDPSRIEYHQRYFLLAITRVWDFSRKGSYK